jgi:Icc-related predicted phosphoesterase
MRLWLVSDLHCDSSPWSPAVVPAHDVLVIAGDVANGQEAALRHLYRIAQFTPAPIIMVPGNHDVFDGGIGDFVGSDRLRADGIHVIEPGAETIIGGVRFVGSTLWTDWQLGEKEFQAQSWAARHMPEYRHVTRADGELIWPIDIYDEHQRHRAALEQMLVAAHDGTTIVVSHHAPSPRSLSSPMEAADAAFASEQEELILRFQPQLWVHGHIHLATDYRIGSTRVICNPRGYQNANFCERTRFDEGLVVEV